ncbi:unnamed protein product, partial [Allacma fusca]
QVNSAPVVVVAAKPAPVAVVAPKPAPAVRPVVRIAAAPKTTQGQVVVLPQNFNQGLYN